MPGCSTAILHIPMKVQGTDAMSDFDSKNAFVKNCQNVIMLLGKFIKSSTGATFKFSVHF